jgi:hypothetical protein
LALGRGIHARQPGARYRRLGDRQTRCQPGFEPADDVADAGEAQLAQARRGEARRLAVVADQDQVGVEPADVRVAPRAFGRDAPLQDGEGDVERAGDDARRAVDPRVDDQRALLGRRSGLCRLEALDQRARFAQQVVERAACHRHVLSAGAIDGPT